MGRWRAPRRPSVAVRVVSILLLLTTFFMQRSIQQHRRQREAETARGQQIIDDLILHPPSPRPSPTKVAAAPDSGVDGWAIDELDVWCDGEVWSGEATVHATTSSFDRLTFDFTLYDATKPVGHLRGRHDGTAIQDPASVALSSRDACVGRPARYRYDVS